MVSAAALGRFSDALCWKGVGGFGDDDPEDEICDGADAGEQGHKRCDDADDVKVPTVVESKAGADSGDHAVLTWARELAGARIIARRRRRGRGDSGSAGRAEARGWIDLFAALSTEHGRLRTLLFCHSETVV